LKTDKGEPLPLAGTRLVVCLGPGGVGKTTTSAALALMAAGENRNVDVMTVDPAPRLLDALGLDTQSADLQKIALDGLVQSPGRLRACKLDPKRTFDEIVARYAPSKSAHEAILSNRLYRNLSEAMAGVADYMAIEKLLDLESDPSTDLIVLDTPPAREALDFLDAPRRMLELLNSRAATLLGASHGFMGQSLTMLDLAARAVLSAFDRLTGLRLLGDVRSFVQSFDGMYQGFAERAACAQALMRDPRTLITVVTTPDEQRAEEAREFCESLTRVGLRIGALIVNRTLPRLPRAAELHRLALSSELIQKLKRNLRDFAALKARQDLSIESIRRALAPDVLIAVAPDLGREPQKLADLLEIARNLQAA
jgi:anion-transporting  ArsA/GET3 family ATPase